MVKPFVGDEGLSLVCPAINQLWLRARDGDLYVLMVLGLSLCSLPKTVYLFSWFFFFSMQLISWCIFTSLCFTLGFGIENVK